MTVRAIIVIADAEMTFSRAATIIIIIANITDDEAFMALCWPRLRHRHGNRRQGKSTASLSVSVFSFFFKKKKIELPPQKKGCLDQMGALLKGLGRGRPRPKKRSGTQPRLTGLNISRAKKRKEQQRRDLWRSAAQLLVLTGTEGEDCPRQ